MDLLIKRIDGYKHSDKQTIGIGYIFNKSNGIKYTFCTLELPWKNNSKNVSCIPKGKYTVIKRKSPKFGLCFLVKDVPNRTWILLHAGNYVTQIEGCILCGKTHADINKDGLLDVTSSRDTIKDMLSHLPSEFEMVIE